MPTKVLQRRKLMTTFLFVVACLNCSHGGADDVRLHGASSRASQLGRRFVAQAQVVKGKKVVYKDLEKQRDLLRAEFNHVNTSHKARRLELVGQKDRALENLRSQYQAPITKLQNEKQQALDELNQGLFCAACNRPPSQIMREDNEEFQAHIRRVGKGTKRVSQEMLDSAAGAFDRKIKALEDQRERALEQLTSQWRERIHQQQQPVYEKLEQYQTIKKRFQEARAELKRLVDQALDTSQQYKAALAAEKRQLSKLRRLEDQREQRQLCREQHKRHTLDRVCQDFVRAKRDYLGQFPQGLSQSKDTRQHSQHQQLLKKRERLKQAVQQYRQLKRQGDQLKQQRYSKERQYYKHRKPMNDQARQAAFAHFDRILPPSTENHFTLSAKAGRAPLKRNDKDDYSLMRGLQESGTKLRRQFQRGFRKQWSRAQKAFKDYFKDSQLEAFDDAALGRTPGLKNPMTKKVKDWLSSVKSKARQRVGSRLLNDKDYDKLSDVEKQELKVWDKAWQRIRKPMSLKAGSELVDSMGEMLDKVTGEITEDDDE